MDRLERFAQEEVHMPEHSAALRYPPRYCRFQISASASGAKPRDVSARPGSWRSVRRPRRARAMSCLIRTRLEMCLRETISRPHDRRAQPRIGGQEAPSELSRFEPDVIGEAPSLVIWQVGTNAVFRKKNSISTRSPRRSRRAWYGWQSMPTDVVLMDLQYTHGGRWSCQDQGIFRGDGEDRISDAAARPKSTCSAASR